MKRAYEIDAEGLRGEMRANEPMSRHTSWRTGGCAKWHYTPCDKDDLREFLQRVPNDVDIIWCGLGSNMLVRDGGFDGVVISTHKGLKRLQKTQEHRIFAEAGVPNPKLARSSAKNSLCGGEFLIGIPGTVGGALAMNAGCFGSETYEIVRYAEVINRCGELQLRNADQITWGYRFTRMNPGEWFTGAEFQFTPCRSEVGQAKIREFLKKRAKTQPVQTANAGSVFQNPAGDFAARLIDAAGLKNFSIGGARVSPKHANFIENQGDATSLQIEEVIQYIKKTVKKIHGVELTLEIKIVGER